MHLLITPGTDLAVNGLGNKMVHLCQTDRTKEDVMDLFLFFFY